MLGNPAKKIGDIRDWTEKKLMQIEELSEIIY